MELLIHPKAEDGAPPLQNSCRRPFSGLHTSKALSFPCPLHNFLVHCEIYPRPQSTSISTNQFHPTVHTTIPTTDLCCLTSLPVPITLYTVYSKPFLLVHKLHHPYLHNMPILFGKGTLLDCLTLKRKH